MTALEKYIRLEAVGQWRENPDQSPREVIVSFGNQTLVLSNFKENPLSHWALAATRRVSLDGSKALYSPDTEGFETLEIDDADMVEAIAQVSRLTVAPVVRKRKLPAFLVFLAVVAAAIYFVPTLMRDQAIRMTEQDSARYLGLEMLAGTALEQCSEPSANSAEVILMSRLFVGNLYRLIVVKSGPEGVVFPGGLLVVGGDVLQGVSSADEFGNWLIELTKTDQKPLVDVFKSSSLKSVFQYISSGTIPQEDLNVAAQDLLENASFPLSAVAGAQIAKPILRDQEWVALQGICLE